MSDARAGTNGDREALTVLQAGATGLVGGACLDRLLTHASVSRVVVVSRRPTGRLHASLAERVVEIASLDDVPSEPADVALCALGTTIAKAGSEAAFRAVDLDVVVAFARFAKRGGATRFVLVSSVGADSSSRNFYLRVKGEAERAVGALGFDALDLLRPSLLLGDRGEARAAETAAQALAPVVNVLLLGPLRKYRAIASDTVAAAMVGAALQATPGVCVHHHDDIQRLAHGSAPPWG